MKHLLFICIFFASFSFADYSKHPEAVDVINLLVTEHDFDRNYVIQVLKSAQKQDNILESISSPAEFTWTWDRYRTLFLEEKELPMAKLLSLKMQIYLRG